MVLLFFCCVFFAASPVRASRRGGLEAVGREAALGELLLELLHIHLGDVHGVIVTCSHLLSCVLVNTVTCESKNRPAPMMEFFFALRSSSVLPIFAIFASEDAAVSACFHCCTAVYGSFM